MFLLSCLILLLSLTVLANTIKQFMFPNTESFMIILVISLTTLFMILSSDLVDIAACLASILIWQFNLIKLNRQD